MTLTHGQKVLRAIEALIGQVRTSNGYRTESGSRVERQAPIFTKPNDDCDWQTLVYQESKERKTGAVARDYVVGMLVNIDILTRAGQGREPDLIEEIDEDICRAVEVQSGRLYLGDVHIGSIQINETTLIPDLINSGLLGLRIQLRIQFRERWGSPATITP